MEHYKGPQLNKMLCHPEPPLVVTPPQAHILWAVSNPSCVLHYDLAVNTFKPPLARDKTYQTSQMSSGGWLSEAGGEFRI